MKRLEGKVAIVTGAASGIGFATAKLFAEEGAKVVLTDISEEKVFQAAESLKKQGGDVLSLVHDVTIDEDWKNVISHTEDQFGSIHILINNAGMASREGIEEITLEKWETVQSVNSTSVFLGIKNTATLIRKAGGGSIINISSIFGIVGSGGSVAYHATKGAVRLISKTAALEYAKDHIRVNSIHPGIIETPLLATNKNLNNLLEKTPANRLGEPTDVAYGALYLASDESKFVTGAELVIDGGYTAQ